MVNKVGCQHLHFMCLRFDSILVYTTTVTHKHQTGSFDSSSRITEQWRPYLAQIFLCGYRGQQELGE